METLVKEMMEKLIKNKNTIDEESMRKTLNEIYYIGQVVGVQKEKEKLPMISKIDVGF